MSEGAQGRDAGVEYVENVRGCCVRVVKSVVIFSDGRDGYPDSCSSGRDS